MDKISVIIPVYNVEQYLKEGIESLLNQTYNNLEIILVDDGSKDSSGMICDEYAKKDARIKVIHTINRGQSCARNQGLQAATGEYISFMDSDDYVEQNRYKKAMKLMLENDADIVECNFDGRRLKPQNDCTNNEVKIMTGIEALSRQLDPNIHYSYPTISVWTKLFKRELVDDISFPEGKVHEEYNFICIALFRCRKYIYTNTVLYHRVLREDSTTAEKFSIRYFDKLEVMHERSNFLTDVGEHNLYRMSKAGEYTLLLELFFLCHQHKMDDKEKEVLRLINSEKKDIRKSVIDKKKKIEFLLFFLNHRLYYFIRKVKNN